MRYAAVSLALSLLAAAATPPARASEPPPTEIRLGDLAAPPEAADPAQVRAVERLLAARQRASASRGRAAEARQWIDTRPRVDDTTLFGARGSFLTAFDFPDGAILPLGSARFEVLAYLLFANPDGQVTESRTERLTFTRRDASWICTDLLVTETIVWWPETVRDAAGSLGAAEEYARAQSFLTKERSGDRRALAYSLADVQKSGGKVVVQCLRYASDLGKRGFTVNDSPIVLTRAADGMIRVESN
jgi:hypothetical protein